MTALQRKQAEPWPGTKYPPHMRRLMRKQRAERERVEAKLSAEREAMMRRQVAERGRAMGKRA